MVPLFFAQQGFRIRTITNSTLTELTVLLEK